MSTEEGSGNVSRDTMASLSFDFLKQLTTLSLAAAGGAVTLLETAFSQSRMKPMVFASAGVLFLAAILSLQAQQILVERLRAGSATYADTSSSRLRLPRNYKVERNITILSFVMFGTGVGVLLVALFYR